MHKLTIKRRGVLHMAAVVLWIFGATTSASAAPLADIAPPGLAVGGVLHGYDPIWNQGDYSRVADREFNAVTATAYMPWIGWNNPENDPSTSGLTKVINWARARGKRVHGHVLVYPGANENLDWYQNPSIDHEAILRRYVRAMARAGAGRMWVWDVVNEVMADTGDSRVDRWGLRNNYIEYRSIGADYVDKAFRWARAADPKSLLIINDYGIEEINQKSNNLLRYVTELRRRAVPIDGIGVQMHLFYGSGGEPDYNSIRRNFQRFANAGFQIFITELDVPITRSNSPIAPPSQADLNRQRRIYEKITRIAVEQPAVKSLLLWDFADDRSWLHPVRQDFSVEYPPGTYSFPTPFSGGAVNGTTTPKPAYYGIADGLRTGRIRNGTYRLTSEWDTNTSWLSRVERNNANGRSVPTNTVSVNRSTNRSTQRWTVQHEGNGYYRIFDNTGMYVTRRGIANNTGGYRPGDQLRLYKLRTQWTSQSWRFEPAGNGWYRIVNRWSPRDGYLTRQGRWNGSGYDPSSSLHLMPADTSWTSQRWRLEPIN